MIEGSTILVSGDGWHISPDGAGGLHLVINNPNEAHHIRTGRNWRTGG